MAFSNRTAWPREPNALAEARLRAESYIDLTQSNPTAIALPPPKIVLPEVRHYAPEPRGLRTAREAISKYYARRNKSVDPERIVITSSTSEAYAFLFRLLGNPSDRVLVPRPSYPLFDYLLTLSDLELVPYRLEYDGSWHLEHSTLAKAAAILVVSPNNPTGSIFSDEEQDAIVQLDIPIIADEVFADFADRDASWIDTGKLTFSLNGLSKSAGLPQLKLSWIVLSGGEELVSEARERLEMIGDTFLSVSSPVQVGLDDILEAAEPWQDKLRTRIATNREALARITRGSPCTARRQSGGWCATLELPRISSDEEWALELLQNHQVLVHPGYLFDMDDHASIVVSLIVPEEDFAEGIMRIVLACPSSGDVSPV